MSYTLKLDHFEHDIRIVDGKFERISGANEVCQRVKVALWHYLGEYFLNRESGIPYYSKRNDAQGILGSKMSQQTVYNIFRSKILAVPGVLRVKNANITKIGRNYYYSCSIVVAPGADGTNEEMTIQNISIGG